MARAAISTCLWTSLISLVTATVTSVRKPLACSAVPLFRYSAPGKRSMHPTQTTSEAHVSSSLLFGSQHFNANNTHLKASTTIQVLTIAVVTLHRDAAMLQRYFGNPIDHQIGSE